MCGVFSHLGRLLAALALLVGAAGAAQAGPVTGNDTGLTNPSNTITFDELNLSPQTLITDQFASYGATFSAIEWDNRNFGQSGSTGFSGGFLLNCQLQVDGSCVFIPSLTITFAQTVDAAVFAAVDQGGSFIVSAYLDNQLVDSFSQTIPFNPGAGFIGFTGEQFDTITITPLNSFFGLDTLEFDVVPPVGVPEPAVVGLFGVGLVALGLVRRRRYR
ncbi:MAG TPA: PEP-CTERM sorting domain-containing protein [Acetobacteraceae bacterium]|nr:PEP-CTERM sorting domain-containing protein [Acetobacteraceae bacterium]